MKRIGCVGDNCVDHYRQTGEDHFGGNPVNVAVYTRRLGGNASYVGAVGTDSRGAGDSFIAGFLHGYLEGLDIPACMTAGAQCSAVTLSYEGAW